MKKQQMTFGLLLLLMGIVAYWSSESMSAPGLSQIVIPFHSKKEFHYHWNQSENALILSFPQVTPNDLEPINNYDEKHVRRVIIKDLAPRGTEVKLVLKTRDIKALVTTFEDPYRVSIDLFDKNFTQRKDPVTGLPIDSIANDEAKDTFHSDANLMERSPSNAPTKMAMASPAGDLKQPTDDIKAPQQKRRLLQAMPDEVLTTSELKLALSKIEPGLGKGWQDYPPYIYRAQLAPFEGREAPESEISSLRNQALKDSHSMANFASKLYDFGHEGRAIAAYQQVLLKDPTVFEKDAVHLWKFAELNLGQGNFQLADGYYNSLIEKHPTHGLAQFAKLRKLDIHALRALESGNQAALVSLADKVDANANNRSPEIRAQSLIRSSWWRDPKASHKRQALPPLAPEATQRSLQDLVSKTESQRTAYLASAVAAERMTRLDSPWDKSYPAWLNNYFARFKGPSTEPTRSTHLEAAKARLAHEIQSTFNKNSYIDVVNLFETLPEPMKSIRKVPEVAWAIGESYRNIGQIEKSVPFMQSATQTNSGVDKFKAAFWMTHLSGQVAKDLKSRKGNQTTIRNMDQLNSSGDRLLEQTWSKLNNDEKARIQTSMSDYLEADVASELRNKTPPKIVLEKWTASLTENPPKVSTANGTNATDQLGNFSPTDGTVRVLDELGRKFAELGMQTERRKALDLMRFIQPSLIKSNKAAQKIWNDQLLKLAEEYRESNDYLEAGELYTLVGENSQATESRAEALYKGGLLLYRAGKKDEAIKALEKAKSDTSNLFYSKLATERLDQLQAH